MMTENATKQGTQTDTSTADQARLNLLERVVKHEWDQFQKTDNEGGRAACQGNWPTFHQMRASQFMTWPMPLLKSYADDLDKADRVGRNLITEKYGRMMISTWPDEYRANIEPYIPTRSAERVASQEKVIAQQVTWADDFRGRYPKLGRGMRVLHTSEDTHEKTSFETYLRGELGTYSDKTFGLYSDFISQLASANRNLTEETIRNTVLLGGFNSLDEAEALQQ